MRLNETDLKLYKFTVSAVLTLAGEDASGQTSSTTTIEQGTKPKVLNCSGFIAKKDEERVKDVFKLAEAKDDNGNRVIYDIVDDTASACNIRQVSFFDVVSISEDEAFKKWKVSFTLKERNSVAEAKEKQEQQATVNVQGVNGTNTSVPDTSSDPANTTEAASAIEVGNMNTFVQSLEDWAGKILGTETEGTGDNASSS